jgi:hypothetical protein
MKKHLFTISLLNVLFYLQLTAQAPKEDILVGTFSNQQNGLLLSVKPISSNTYEGFLEYQGKSYPFSGRRLLGMLSGEYAYEGAQISFTLARIMTVYYLTSDGVSLEMVRTNTAPANTAQAGTTPNPPNPQSPPTNVVQTPVPTNAPVATGPRINDPYGSFTFQLPAGWSQTEPEGPNILITNQNYKAQISIAQHNYSSLAEIRKNTLDIRDAGSNTDMKATIRDYGNSGLFIRYEGIAQGQAVIIETVALASPYGGGISIVGAGLKPDYAPEVGNAVKSIANSIQFKKTTDTPVVQQWRQRLVNKQLLYLYTGNGMSEKTTIDLCANGRFQYDSNDSYSSGGYFSDQLNYAGSNAESGSWKVISKNSFPVLMLFYGDGRVIEHSITARQAGNEINLSGRRYFLQASSMCE